jgi:hydroxypyruvate reductase
MSKHSDITRDAIAIWNAGVAAVNAKKLVRDSIQIVDSNLEIAGYRFPINSIGRVVVVGFGKASGAMAVGLEQSFLATHSSQSSLPQIVGQVNVPDDQVATTQQIRVEGCRPAGENLPTNRVVLATERIIELVSAATVDDVCICLISGGGSALLESPVAPVTLDELRSATTTLSRSGADIAELNAVRRQISNVKGGKLAAYSGGAPVISLIVSDVVGDPLDVIASGPTVQPTGSISAIDVLRKYDADESAIPNSIWSVVKANVSHQVKVKFDHRVENIVIGNIETTMGAAAEKARSLGYIVDEVSASANEGDAELVGRSVAHQVVEEMVEQVVDQKVDQTTGDRKLCQIRGGETTVKVCENPGNGGRNQHLVLAAMGELLKCGNEMDCEHELDCGYGLNSEFCVVSGGTDGEDGTQPVAGAFVDTDSLRRLRQQEVLEMINAAINSCDSYGFHSEHGTLLHADQTSTNVGDLRIVLTSKACSTSM